MNKSRSNVFIMLNLIVSFFISACSSPREQVKIENGTFNINGKDVQLICGEMHYPRIPHECNGVEHRVCLCILELP